jgi:hypothetical protein
MIRICLSNVAGFTVLHLLKKLAVDFPFLGKGNQARDARVDVELTKEVEF